MTTLSESKLKPSSTKGIQTRARIVAAAKATFERDGLLESRITDIAAEAGIGTGSIYYYFENKEQIFHEVASAQEARLTAPTADGHGDGEGAPSAWDRIRRANRRYLERYREEAGIMGVIEQVSRYDDQVNAARMATMKHFVERAERAIKALQAEGLADPRLNPSVASDALGAMVGRFAELWLVQKYRPYNFDEAVEQLTLLWGNALGLSPDAIPPRA